MCVKNTKTINSSVIMRITFDTTSIKKIVILLLKLFAKYTLGKELQFHHIKNEMWKFENYDRRVHSYIDGIILFLTLK